MRRRATVAYLSLAVVAGMFGWALLTASYGWFGWATLALAVFIIRYGTA